MLDFITRPVLLLLEVVCLPLCCALVLPHECWFIVHHLLEEPAFILPEGLL